MEALFEFITLIIMSHLFIGCSIVALIGGLLRFLSLNAATRHNIWLGLLVILLLMPLVSFLSTRVIDEPLTAQSVETVLTTGQLTLPARNLQAAINSEAGITRSISESGPVQFVATTYSLLKKFTTVAINALPLYGLGVAFTLIIGFVIVLKLLLFVRSYRKLRELFDTSENVDDDWLSRVAILAAQIGVRTSPAVKCSTEINTPSTSGMLNPWIVLPVALLEAKKSPQSMEQILLHELAHIKRRDPFIASLQALISIFMFWHPAIYYVNRKIRFERELACDDWVINHTDRDNSAQVRSYANSLLEIAESLQGKVSIEHSVACVHTSHGLVNRIEFMLDRNVDHSTSVKRTRGAVVTFSALALLIVSLPSWPQLPITYTEKAEQEIAANHPVSDRLKVDTQDSPLLTDDSKLPAEFENSQQAKTESSQLPAELGKLLAESEDPHQAIAENPQPFAEVSKTLVESPPRRQAKTADLSSQLVENISASNEIALRTVPADILVPLVNPELESSVGELGEGVQNQPIARGDINLVEQVDSVETVTGNMAEISPGSAEPSRETVIVPATQSLKPVSTGGQSRSVIVANSVLHDEASITEFIIIEDLSRSELRKEILKIQGEFYRVFNESTGEEQLKIHCENRPSTGSHIRKRVCEPQFAINARNYSGAYWFNETNMFRTSVDFRADKNLGFKKLATAMNVEMKENRYLLELNQVLRMLMARLNELA